MTIDKAERGAWERIDLLKIEAEQNRYYAERDREHEYKMSSDSIYKECYQKTEAIIDEAIEASMKRARKLYREVKFN